jgi:hypothetical protein
MGQVIRVFFALLLVAAMVLAVGWVLWVVGSWFFALPATTMTPVAALTGVVLVPVITYFTSRNVERRRSLENSIREQKTKLYDEMMRGLVRMLNLQKGTLMNEAEMLRFFADITPQLINYGSRRVLGAWNSFRTVSREKTGDTTAIMLSFENLLKAMRKDLGHSVLTHQKGELLGVFVNDVDTLFKK